MKTSTFPIVEVHLTKHGVIEIIEGEGEDKRSLCIHLYIFLARMKATECSCD